MVFGAAAGCGGAAPVAITVPSGESTAPDGIRNIFTCGAATLTSGGSFFLAPNASNGVFFFTLFSNWESIQ